MIQKGFIVVVDDDLDYVESLESILEEEGYAVKTAGDGKAALDLLSRAASIVDIIVLDIDMPGIHGLEFLNRIRRIDKEIPIIIASSRFAMRHDFTVTTAPQVKHFLDKPFELEYLLELLPRFMGTRRAGKNTPFILLGEGDSKGRQEMAEFFQKKGFFVTIPKERDAILGLLKRVGPFVDVMVLSCDLLRGEDRWTNVNEEVAFLTKITTAYPQIPFFLISDRQKDKDIFLQKNIPQLKGFLLKPVDLEVFTDRLSRVVEGN